MNSICSGGVAWAEDCFVTSIKKIKQYDVGVDTGAFDLKVLCGFLYGKRNFLLGLLENPVLIEHEGFSESLLSVFHLSEELNSRKKLGALQRSDLQHLSGDINRVYRKLTVQWIIYMGHLKREYPYLFSLAVGTNPFDIHASQEVID